MLDALIAKCIYILEAQAEAEAEAKAEVPCTMCLMEFEDEDKCCKLLQCGHMFNAESIEKHGSSNNRVQKEVSLASSSIFDLNEIMLRLHILC